MGSGCLAKVCRHISLGSRFKGVSLGYPIPPTFDCGMRVALMQVPGQGSQAQLGYDLISPSLGCGWQVASTAASRPGCLRR